MENTINVVTSQQTRENAAAAFGLNVPSVLDTVDRAQFASDAAYIDAVAKEMVLRDNPVYKEAARKATRELQERKNAEEQKAREEKQKEIRRTMQLASFELENIDREALEMARRDVSAGRISPRSVGAAAEQYAKDLAEKMLDKKSADKLFNMIIRGQI